MLVKSDLFRVHVLEKVLLPTSQPRRLAGEAAENSAARRIRMRKNSRSASPRV